VTVAAVAAVTRDQLLSTDLWLHTSSEPPPPEEHRPAWAAWWF
jgi:hypothetical protein